MYTHVYVNILRRLLFKIIAPWKQLQHQKETRKSLPSISKVKDDLSPGNLTEATGKLPSDRPAHSQALGMSIQWEGLQAGAGAGQDVMTKKSWIKF